MDLQLKRNKKSFAAVAGKIVMKTLAFSAAAVGAFAVGTVAIRRIAVQNFRLKKIDIEELNVARLRVKNISVTDQMNLPENSNKPRKAAVSRRTPRKKKEEVQKSA